MKKILITGANGLLGYHLSRIFKDEYELIITGIEADSATQGLLGLNYQLLDIRDFSQVINMVESFKPEWIINAAAYTNVDGCEREGALSYAVNVTGPQNLAKAAKAQNAGLIHFSSDYIFDGENGPYSEDDAVNPISAYGRQKLAAEKLILAEMDKHIIIRTNVLFGKGPSEAASFVRWIADSLRQGKTIRIVDDQYNNPTYSNDLALAAKMLLEAELWGIWNYGGADYLNRYEFARLIAKVFEISTGKILAIPTAELQQIAPRPLRGGLRNDKIVQAIPVPQGPLTEILKEMKESGY
ncbi:MAG TPA: dTDP-4-dehydrorhamnose reductase [Candidatus Marinimicrobia bacterium]|nr:dTDP-4-dehydrorhamnose reductase [Candidatus Neomarinimicrobiota bacterium]